MAWFGQVAKCLTSNAANTESRGPLLLAAGISVLGGIALGSLLHVRSTQSGQVISSPRQLLQTLPEDERKKHALPLDLFPGARDVQTPYGNIRVYEWGPEDGPKVLFVHGITTPCLALGGLAHTLADKGYRVMLFDLFGRGLSDVPADLPQDNRLFATQILLALASSPVSWTGSSSGGFSLIGYSLGGGIAVGFASYFPDLISSLILIAPSGLIRDSHMSLSSRILGSGWLPDCLVIPLVKSRLRAGPLVKPKDEPAKPKKEGVSVGDALANEISSTTTPVLSRQYPTLSQADVVQWQVEHHTGFPSAFISSLRHGPVGRRRELQTWKRLGRLLTQRKLMENVKGLKSGRVLIVLGEKDTIIHRKDLMHDAAVALEGNAEFKAYPTGHELPSVQYEDLAAQLIQFWNR